MINSDTPTIVDFSSEEKIKEELTKAFESKRKRIFTKFVGAALGSVPWVGGLLSGMVDFKSDESQHSNNKLQAEWLNEHSKKLRELTAMLVKIMLKLDEFPDEKIDERIESEEYSQIVKKSFRCWDNADTQEKRELVRKLLTNAGASTLVPDDLIRLFIDWLNLYHEIHFAVIRCIYQNTGITRYEIWNQLNGNQPREDSMEADLFKLLIRDLSTGGVIRQHKPTDGYGNFLRQTPKKLAQRSTTLKSAFDDKEGYELTELGRHFVHYTMEEVVPKIG